MRKRLVYLFTIDTLLLFVIFAIIYFSLSFFSLRDYYSTIIDKYNNLDLDRHMLLLSLSLSIILMTILRLITISKKLNVYKKLSLVDPLTNLYNRRHIGLNIQKLISEYKRSGNTFSMIMIDIDFFKKVNDKYGHNKGDEVLKGISKFIVSNVRNNDIIGRWGGEEFIILCPNNSIKDSYIIAEKLRNGIEKLYFQNEIKITASFGISEYKDFMSSDQDILINRVDEALYNSKKNGRNQISIFE